MRCITRVQGGLGNQLFCYAYGSGVADRLGAELVLDVSDLEHGDGYGRRFDLDRLGVSVRRVSSPWLAGPIGRIARPLLRRAFRRRVYREPRVPGVRVPSEPWIYLDGYWQADPGINDRREELRNSIMVEPSLLSESVRALAVRLWHERAIGVHVRTYEEEKVAARRTTPSRRYFSNALERIFAEFGPRPIFVASDRPLQDPDFPTALQARVIDPACSRSQYEDLQLLRSCAYHVLSNSSFGWWGAFLAESACTYYPANAGYFHYPAPARGWRVVADPS
jgi:hypothetical protein